MSAVAMVIAFATAEVMAVSAIRRCRSFDLPSSVEVSNGANLINPSFCLTLCETILVTVMFIAVVYCDSSHTTNTSADGVVPVKPDTRMLSLRTSCTPSATASSSPDVGRPRCNPRITSATGKEPARRSPVTFHADLGLVAEWSRVSSAVLPPTGCAG